MSGMPDCTIPANSDISGVGVRVAIYAQNIFSFIPAFYALADYTVDSQELKTIEDQSTTILVTAFAILVSTIIQARTLGLADYHASIILNLSWMNNTNTYIYFILYVHHHSRVEGDGRIPPRWSAWIRHATPRFLRRRISNIEEISMHESSKSTVSIDDTSEEHNGSTTARVISNLVILLGSLHFTLMSIIGLWMWISPYQFEEKQGILLRPTDTSDIPLKCTFISILGQSVPLTSPGLRKWSLLVYGLFLTPGLNVFIPVAFFLAIYIGMQRRNRSLLVQRRPSALPVVVGLALLLAVNIIFIVDTELTVHRVRNQQPGESAWSFGQTLALLLLVLPIRDTALLNSYRQESKRRAVQTKFLEAIEAANVEKVRKLAGNPFVDVNMAVRTGHFASALQLAAFKGDKSLAQQLLQRRAWVLRKGDRIPSDEYFSVLEAACRAGNEAMVEWLLANGVDPAPKLVDGSPRRTPLHCAASWCSVPISKMLLAAGVDVDAVDSRGETPLHYAVRRASEPVHGLLLERTILESVCDNDGTLFHIASRLDREPIVRLLLSSKANPDAADANGETPLHYAAREGSEAIMNLLLEHSTREPVNHDGDTPLHIASSLGHESVVKVLLDHGARVTATNHKHQNPLHCASEGGHESTARLLVLRNAALNDESARAGPAASAAQ